MTSRRPRGARRAALWLASILWLVSGGATAQPLDSTPIALGVETPARLAVAVDADDDDDDGTPDAAQSSSIPPRDLLAFHVVEGAATVEVSAGLRLVDASGAPLSSPHRARAAERLSLQGVRVGASALTVEAAGRRREIPVDVIGVALLGGDLRRLSAHRDSVGVSHEVTNGPSLPRRAAWDEPSPDPDNVRVEVFDPRAEGLEAVALLRAVDPTTGAARANLPQIALSRPRRGLPFRSPWLRLVGDRVDVEAPGVGRRVLRVALRDRVEAVYETAGGLVSQSLRVGRPGDEDGPTAARRARLRLHVMRVRPGGPPVIGGDDAGAIRMAREQVSIANEIWLQCFIDFGPPADAEVILHDPPPPTLLSVADSDGLPARGGGQIRLRIDDRAIRPVTTRAGAPATSTALDVARAVRALGFTARVYENSPTEFGAGRSADVLVRTREGAMVTLTPDGAAPLSSDARQRVRLARVEMGDGIGEFDNMNASAGTLEERGMLRPLADDDPATIDLFIINRFASGTRQGEAFIESDGGAIVNTVLLDRNGMSQQRAAWTQSHELGHVLLNQPFHPDNVGADRPWLLMDADSSLSAVTGPKRLTWDECHRVRIESGVDARPALLERRSPRAATPAPTPPHPLGY